ncbi:DegT/DnrJ/EryC1/StrS aminotransferase family protein [bacterium]|nr:DegT/DnrJ/EryC1/StrS aminotransferase family protein [bacterium]MDB9962607.1 DegT/DnrJ/EryC1/StrS aminotransferase family protein [Planktomarina temperata]
MQTFPLMRNNILREDLDLVIEHLKQDDPILTNGPMCRKFEREWSDWLGVKYSVFVSSGSAANLISMALLKDKHPEGGEVLVPCLTWVSDIASVIQNGFTPIFCDIDPRNLAMGTDEIIARISDKTVAVFLTHVQGFNGLSERLLTKLSEKKIPLIEDVCESHGATFRGKRVGSFGWMSNFSFYYAHHMSTIEGGMVCTNDEELYQKIRMFRSHGMLRETTDSTFQAAVKESHPDLNPDFIFLHPAYNLRNNEIGAIIGSNQLKRLDDIVISRTENQKLFFEHVDANKYQTDFDFEGSSNYAFNLILKDPDTQLMQRLSAKLRDKGVEFRRGSAGGGNQLRQPYLTQLDLKQKPEDFPNAEHVHFYGMYIGNFPSLEQSEIKEICSILNSV